MLRIKPTTIAMSNVCGSESSEHKPHIILLCGAPDYIATHLIIYVHIFCFILFVSSGLGICDRLNSLVCTVIRGSLTCPVKVPGMLSEFCFILMRLIIR